MLSKDELSLLNYAIDQHNALSDDMLVLHDLRIDRLPFTYQCIVDRINSGGSFSESEFEMIQGLIDGMRKQREFDDRLRDLETINRMNRDVHDTYVNGLCMNHGYGQCHCSCRCYYDAHD